MNEKSFDMLERKAKRAMEIISRPGQSPVIAATAIRFKSSCPRFLEAQANVRKASATAVKEGRESVAALGELAKPYDAMRTAISSNAPEESLGPASSSFATPDDFITGCEHVEEVLEAHAGEEWASPLIPVFTLLLESAQKEWLENVTSQSALQKAKNERRETAQAVSADLKPLRRAVRVVYGSTSKEYHSIKMRGATSDDEPAEPADTTVQP